MAKPAIDLIWHGCGGGEGKALSAVKQAYNYRKPSRFPKCSRCGRRGEHGKRSGRLWSL